MGRKLLYPIIGCTAIIFLILSGCAQAADNDTVDATVTVQNISVSLDQGSGIPFGTLSTSDTQDTTSNGLGVAPDYTITATNDGNVTEDFDIQSDDSTSSGTGWTLATSPGSNTYTLMFCTATCDSTPSWTDVGINPATAVLATSIAGDSVGTQSFDLQIETPTSTTDYNEQTITVTVIASAS